jgi:hypothetical protein
MSTKKESRNLLDELETLQQVLDDAAGEQVDLERALTQLNTVDEVPVLSDLHAEPESTAPLKPVSGTKPAAVMTPLRPVSKAPNHPLDLRSQLRQLSPSEALDALHKQIDSLPEEQRLGEDWFGKRAATEAQALAETQAPAETVTLDDILGEADSGTPAAPDTQVSDTKTQDTAAPKTTSTPTPNAADGNAANPFLPQSVIDRLTHERLAAQHSAEEAHRTMQRATQRIDKQNTEAAAALDDKARDKLIEEMIQEMIPHIQARLRERLRQMLKPATDDTSD